MRNPRVVVLVVGALVSFLGVTAGSLANEPPPRMVTAMMVRFMVVCCRAYALGERFGSPGHNPKLGS